MHDIQVHFFDSCQRHDAESICATGFLESMIPADGKMTPEELYDMETSVTTGPDHLMLSGESTYGAQAAASIELEATIQRSLHEKMQSGEVQKKPLPKTSLGELLYIL